MKVTVLSDGGWGTALSLVLCENKHIVTLWGAFPEYIDSMKKSRENTKFLKGVKLPKSLILESNLKTAIKDSEIIILATPSQYMRITLFELKKYYKKKQLLVNVAKGIENNSLFRMSELCDEILKEYSYCVLSGPSHAEEVVKKLPTAVVVASKNKTFAEKVQKAFMNKYFRVYTTDDVTSVELGGALKNVIAIAAGIIDGLELGDNPKAALITRGIAEMSRLGVKLGGHDKTFSGLSGLGDLIVTCASKHSRNRFVGEELGKGHNLDEIIKMLNMVVAEGVKTTQSAYLLANKIGIETPIVNEVYKILYKNKSAKRAVFDLMTRDPKSEVE